MAEFSNVRLHVDTIALLKRLERQMSAARDIDQPPHDDAVRAAVLIALDHVPEAAAKLPERKRAAS